MSKDKGAKRPPLIFAEDMTDEMMEFTIETTKVRRGGSLKRQRSGNQRLCGVHLLVDVLDFELWYLPNGLNLLNAIATLIKRNFDKPLLDPSLWLRLHDFSSLDWMFSERFDNLVLWDLDASCHSPPFSRALIAVV